MTRGSVLADELERLLLRALGRALRRLLFLLLHLVRPHAAQPHVSAERTSCGFFISSGAREHT